MSETSDTCIVCLGDLEAERDELPPLAARISSPSSDEAVPPKAKVASPQQGERVLIAHLLPCGHNLHDECLRPWVERANSCPICRRSFNSVELVQTVGGPVISSYPVQDRTQVAEIDPSMLIEEEDDSDSAPCIVCGDDSEEELLLLCDACSNACHTYCAGLGREVPAGHWYCEPCAISRAIAESDPGVSPTRSAHHPADRRTIGQRRRFRNRNQITSSSWARVWQSVWDRLNIDLDFPFDDVHHSSSRRAREREQEREFREWERRLRVAERQGGAARFRDTANTLLEIRGGRPRPEPPEPESQDELRAWNAFEKAKEIQTTPSSAGRNPASRKRKSATASPAEPDPVPEPERKLKRPRTRRNQELNEAFQDTAGEGSSSGRRPGEHHVPAGQTTRTGSEANGSGPSFLQSLLKEVESSSAPNEESSFRAGQWPAANNDHASPRISSPGASPTGSNHPSPRALSATPPPFPNTRPGSPLPLTSKIEPVFIPAEFSPPRLPPLDGSGSNHETSTDRSRGKVRPSRPAPASSPPSSPSRSKDGSPTRPAISLSAKADLQKMVSAALKPHYHKNEISKDQFTDINRNISRMLYDKAGDVSFLDQEARDSWKKVATEEVSKAVEALQSTE
ncbi:hypothetical protein L228DRAFT_155238 [Xylona heveae TC161]|uniref:PHD-type domain-containing protein n=1 Tax=Xylona heveae (strain CBS 132557 / TC161) TaxID=1328760 RepID=A0A165FYJ1_XYLHT|nr:hypothetical protein L228DRAFT_155238 [Xylona heveae TC161]KZF21535.1 hypothetical protein L228DRAFT_155238 [Xylona heveae TC161]